MTYAETLASNTQYVADLNAGKKKAVASDATNAQTELSGDLDFFLKLLTVQLKQQDPTEPLDTNQLTQQIATLSSVQQQINTNKNLETLIGATKNSQLSTAIGYIGAEIETSGNTGQVLNGQGAFAYNLPKQAASAKITISDSTGKIVFEGEGTKTAGRNIIVWDGSNSVTGATSSPDGTYKISVIAKDTQGKDITVETSAVGIVSSVEHDADGDIILTMGDMTKKFDDIIAVRAASRVQVDTSETGTNNASTTSDTTSGS
jgi:flagellar basal-body rod modification protein FlgD